MFLQIQVTAVQIAPLIKLNAVPVAINNIFHLKEIKLPYWIVYENIFNWTTYTLYHVYVFVISYEVVVINKHIQKTLFILNLSFFFKKKFIWKKKNIKIYNHTNMYKTKMAAIELLNVCYKYPCERDIFRTT